MTIPDRRRHETGLATLHEALDLVEMSKRLRTLVDRGDRFHLSAADVVAYTYGERAVIAYQTDCTHGPRAILIGKVFSEPVRATTLHRLLVELQAVHEAGQECRVPRPLGHLPELGMALYWASNGTQLGQLHGDDRQAGMVAAAKWLAAFHGSRVHLDRQLDMTVELRSLTSWAELVARDEPRAGPLASRLTELLHRFAPVIQTSTGSPIHKDFQYQHVLVEDGHAVVIDLDEARAGDAALDVAHFGANLRLLALRQNIPCEDVARLETTFLDTYSSRIAYRRDARHDFFYAYTCLKIAKQLARGRGPAPAPNGPERTRQLEHILREGLRSLRV